MTPVDDPETAGTWQAGQRSSSMRDDDIFLGGCACGAVRFTARGAPLRAGLCHCLTCRKAHAAAFNPFVVFHRDQVEVTGELRRWRSSPGYARNFCPTCGSRVSGEIIDAAEIELSLGNFDDVGGIAPLYESWIITREPWLLPLNVPQHERERTAG